MSVRGGSAYVKLAKWGKWHPTLKGKTRCGLRGVPRKTAVGIGDDPMCCDCTRAVLAGHGWRWARTYRTRSAIAEALKPRVHAAAVVHPPFIMPHEAPESTFPTTQVVIVVALVAGIIMMLAGLFE